MAKPKGPKGKPGGSGGGDGPPPKKPSQKHGSIDASKGVSSAQDATFEVAQKGRPKRGGKPGSPATKPTTPRKTNLPQSKVDEIVALGHGNRPDPRTYMSKADIDAHLQPFRDHGAVRFYSKDNFKRFGSLGPPGGAYSIPAKEFGQVMARNGRDLKKVETELGLVPGTLTGKDAMIVHIKPENLQGLRMPSGNEKGANEYWLPGGYTSGGVPEATIDTPPGLPHDKLEL